LTGLAFDPSGSLFASTTSAPLFPPPGAPPTAPVSTLIRVDPVTGEQVSLVGTIQLADGAPLVINDLALQPGTGVLFGTAINFTTGTNNIYTINRTTAVATLVARHSNKCVDVRGEATADGGQVIQWSCNGGANQTWLLRPVMTGTPQQPLLESPR
jgi:hypothetical protein